MSDLLAKAPIEGNVIKVDADGAFDILIGDCLRMEPFPREIQVIGRGHGWTERMKMCAAQRGWKLEITITEGG